MDLLVVSNTASSQQARALANNIGCGFFEIKDKVFFSSKEIYLCKDNIPKCSRVCVFFKVAADNPNSDLYLLFMMIQKIKTATLHIDLIIPYLPYGRSEDSLQFLLSSLDQIGVDKIFTIDLHCSSYIPHHWNGRLVNISSAPLFAEHLYSLKSDCVIAPDQGAKSRAREVSALLGLDLKVLQKQRGQDSIKIRTNIPAQIAGKNCIIFDDIIDSGATMIAAARYLANHGAKISAICATHIINTHVAEKISQTINAPIIHAATTICKIGDDSNVKTIMLDLCQLSKIYKT